MTQPSSWQSAVELVLARRQRLDVLINNAGRHADSLLATMPREDWTKILATNLDSAFYGCQAVLPAAGNFLRPNSVRAALPVPVSSASTRQE